MYITVPAYNNICMWQHLLPLTTNVTSVTTDYQCYQCYY